MKKAIFLIFTLLLAFGIMPTISNAQLADGTYSINYQVNKPGEQNASIANDYFLKPAKLIVTNGKQKIQITIKNSAWVTEFSSPHGGNKVVSTNAASDQRTIEFNIASINSPTVISMKVDIDNMSYHHSYSTDFVWNASSVTLIEAAKTTNTNTNTNKDTSKSEPAKNNTATSSASSSKNTASNQQVNKNNSSSNSSSNQSSSNASSSTKDQSAVEDKSSEDTNTNEEDEAEAAENEVDDTTVEEENVDSTEIEESIEEVATVDTNTTDDTTAEETSNTWIYILGIAIFVIIAVAIIILVKRKRK